VAYPPFVKYQKTEKYRAHFEALYCCGPIETFDGISVRFRKSDFDHAFYESSRRDGHKDEFSTIRAERIDWIKVALQDPESELYEGWDNKKKRHDKNRRVAIVMYNYVVIIALTGEGRAVFKTAYVDRSIRAPGQLTTIDKIRSGPKWTQKNR